MPFTIGPIARRTLAASALAVCLSAVFAQAQAPVWAPAYPMRLTAARALAVVDAARQNLPYVPGEVLVKFKNGIGPAGQRRALRALRSQPQVGALRWRGEVAVLRDEREMNSSILATQLREQPEVEYAEPNYLYHVSRTPNDPGFSRSQWNFTAIDMPRAWDINAGANDSLTVAVIDTGVTTVNATFQFRTWNGTSVNTIAVPFAVNPDFSVSRLVGGQDFVFWDGPVLDMVGHGTHVSSTIGEDTDNDLAFSGIAYKAKVMPLKACFGYWELMFVLTDSGFRDPIPFDAGGCPDDAVVEAIRYAADNGARIINLSLGGETPSIATQEALKYAVGKGAFVAVAMGNAYEDGNPTEYPAAYAPAIPGVVSVGSVGRSLNRAYYGSSGPHMELSAPGGDFRDGGFDGLIWQSTLSDNDVDPQLVSVPRFDRYFEVPYQGTSMAAPHVAGVAALVIAQGVTNPAAVEALLERTARDLGAAGRDSEFGFGLVQPRAALFGFGVAR